MKKKLIPARNIESSILALRGQRVMLDSDLAELYGVETKQLTRALRRNRERFPADFMFRLTSEEFHNLRFQSGTSSVHGGRRYLPYAFTEQGVAMLSSVLRSKRAVAVNIEIMRAFVRMRRMLQTVEDLARKLEALEKKSVDHDDRIKLIFMVIEDLMNPTGKPPREIGFHAKPEDQ